MRLPDLTDGRVKHQDSPRLIHHWQDVSAILHDVQRWDGAGGASMQLPGARNGLGILRS